ncbi:MAG: undecaprenyl-diphosphate phosphatase [Cellulomonadaceae bacterium]|jgi:undecaprenyl-diphosphatase|nr:undecaprenyl-diphosphate phosphatase [Cellulomonadaceae bacterium]
MSFWHALILGIVEGITEFLPVSSTAHLTAVSNLLGYQIDDRGVTAFTAVIQVGAILAVIIHFWRDIVNLLRSWVTGLLHKEQRGTDYRAAWVVLLGSIPIGIVGFLLRDVISGVLRNMWVIVAALILWSIVIWFAERNGRQERDMNNLTIKDAFIIGAAQCLALIPGVSRSGATISAGLFRGLDRVTATRLSFLMGIPALLAAGAFEAIGSMADIGDTVGWGATLIATAVSFGVAWLAISWLLKLVAGHPITVFIWWRLFVAWLIALMLVSGAMSTTGAFVVDTVRHWWIWPAIIIAAGFVGGLLVRAISGGAQLKAVEVANKYQPEIVAANE